MSARAFRFPFFGTPLFSMPRFKRLSVHRRLGAWFFAPRKPRRPALRIVLALFGLGLLLVLVAVGIVVGAAMIAANLAFGMWRRRGKPIAAKSANASEAIDGEYRVLRKPALSKPMHSKSPLSAH